MGSGFRTFAASEVLTSSNVQNYLMDQAVTVHSGTAVLATAIPSPEAGMVAYVNSGDVHEGLFVNTGGGWLKGPGWNAPWGVLAHFSTTTAFATTSLTAVEINTAFRLTVGTVANRRLKLSWQANYANVGGGGLVEFYNVTTATTVGRPFQQNSTIGDGRADGGFVVINSPSVTTTYTMRWHAVTAGTLNLGSGGQISQFTIEDIGPSGAPA